MTRGLINICAQTNYTIVLVLWTNTGAGRARGIRWKGEGKVMWKGE